MDWSRCSDVESRPGVLSGAYVIKGSRVPVEAVIDNAEDGFSPEEITADIYPSLLTDRVRRIIDFARQHDAHPA